MFYMAVIGKNIVINNAWHHNCSKQVHVGKFLVFLDI